MILNFEDMDFANDFMSKNEVMGDILFLVINEEEGSGRLVASEESMNLKETKEYADHFFGADDVTALIFRPGPYWDDIVQSQLRTIFGDKSRWH